MAQFKNPYRFLARIVIETTTPLQIGSGKKGIKTDSLVLRDVNGLPFIPGTTLAGLIRHSLDNSLKESLMGNQKEGSRLIITEARMLDNQGRVLDGIINQNQIDAETKTFLSLYKELPIRQHVRITHRGTAEDRGKFDEEIVLKGTRFCLEMEMISNEETDAGKFKQLLNIIQSPIFRIGSGSRSGFGSIKFDKCLFRQISLNDVKERKEYLAKNSNLSEEWSGWASAKDMKKHCDNVFDVDGWTAYQLSLSPEDFILFGSGFGDEKGNADMTYVKEAYIEWDGDKANRKEREEVLLIPGSSIKGALSHRTAFYYNQLTGAVIQSDGTLRNGKTIDELVGKNNYAVKSIFGSEGEKNPVSRKMINKQRGNILISDVIELKDNATPKILNHVSIDRFTGGPIYSALFSEETLYAKGLPVIINLLVSNQAFEDKIVMQAFESALKDVATGMLPLGGGVNRGNGCFTGKAKKYNKEGKQWEELA